MKAILFLVLLWTVLDLITLAITHWLRRRNCIIVKSEGFESLENYILGGNFDDEES